MTIGILIVDDSDYMRSRIKSTLTERDYRIVGEAVNGARAVELFKRHGDEIDLVLMDIVMRKANGVKATAAIKHLDADTNVIMCTSVGQRKKMKLAAKAGADGYVTKPFSSDDILTAIREVVGVRVTAR